MASTAETDAEDVNDFLKRIQEMGNKRDQEDEERNKKLEEEILQGRRERQARRAERAKSISNKDGLNSNRSSYRASAIAAEDHNSAASTPNREESPSQAKQATDRDGDLNDTMDRLTGGARTPSPLKENFTRDDDDEREFKRNSIIRNSPSNAMPSRSGTVSWQQRPKSRAGRTLSIIASENAAARSTSKTPEPPANSSEDTDTAPRGRDAIAQSLASRDPAFFRQSAEGGRASAAFRKNQVEDNDTIESHNSGPRMQLPGMSASPQLDLNEILNAGSNESRKAEERPASTVSRTSTPSVYSINNADANRNSMASPIPIKKEHHLPPPISTSSRDRSRDRSRDGNVDIGNERAMAMSPSQRDISPERLERQRPLSASPTKGMGGFVQSAMMKRSDSVNKRWSVQSGVGFVRSSALAGNRQSVDMGSPFSSNRDTRSNSILSRDATATTSTSRPTSSHSNATLTRDSDLSSFNGSYMGKNAPQTLTDDVYTRPTLPSSKTTGSFGAGAVDVRTRSTESSRSRPQSRSGPGDITIPAPLSPSKTGGRWSPTKSSWLESALNKPDSPKPSKPAPLQPSWMAEISKAKEAKASGGLGLGIDSERSPSPEKREHKHTVSIEGLKRAPGMGGHKPQKSIADIAKKFGAASPAMTSSPVFKKFEDKSMPSPSPKPMVKTDRKPSYEVKRVTKPVVDERKTPVHTPTEEKEEPKFDEKKASPVAEAKSEPAPFNNPLTRTRTGTLKKFGDIASPTTDRPKPTTPPKFDFRGNLKPKVPPPSNTGTNEPEFKNVFGQLRRTKTQNYKAPDELKDNILRGKAGLVNKGGPVKSERVDEFKDAILKKKEEFQKAVEDGTAVAVTKKLTPQKTGGANEDIPEALAKAQLLGRSGTIKGLKTVDIPAPAPKPKVMGDMPVRERAKSISAKHAEIVDIKKPSRTPSPAEKKKDEAKEPASAAPIRTRAKSIVSKQEAFSRTDTLNANSTPAIASAAASLRKWEKPQPVEKKDDEKFAPPLRSKTDGPGSIRSRFENKFAAPTPKLETETSAPGRLQLQGKLAGNKLAERFNPALAGLLARGPPAAEPGSSVKTSSAASAPSASNDDGEPKEGPKLEHKTKARARGPKRKAPSSVATASAKSCAPATNETKAKVVEVEKKEEKTSDGHR